MKQKTVRFRSIEREDQFKAKKRAVLKEAAKHFATHGVNQTSLEDIASKLKISKPALYYYVKSKDEIISECLSIAHSDDAQEVEAISRMDIDGWSKYRKLMEYYGRLVVSDFGKCLVLVDRNVLSPSSREKHIAAQRYLLDAVRKLYQAGLDDGSIASGDPKITSFAIVGALNSLAYWFDPKGALPLASAIDIIIQSFESSTCSKYAI